MTKGIREYAASRFVELLPTVADVGPTMFRRKIMDEIEQKFQTSGASAAAAYNFALQQMKQYDPKAVSNIGRGSTQFDHVGQAAGQGARAQWIHSVAQSTRQGQGAGRGASQVMREMLAPNRGAVARVAQNRRVANAAEAARVTIIKARSGEVVFKDLPRDAAEALVSSMGSGRGRAKLVIKEDAGA